MSGARLPEVDGGCDVERALDLLLDAGSLIVRSAAPRQEVESVDRELASRFASTPFSVGRFYGARTVRFGRVFAVSEGMRRLAVEPLPRLLAAGSGHRGRGRVPHAGDDGPALR